MSSLKNKTSRDFSVFDTMSTEKLEEILRQDAMLSEAESDTEAILYILEVIEKRESEHPTHDLPDVEASWKEFNELYRPFKDPHSLWAEEEPAPATAADAKKLTRHRPVRHIFRAAYIAAVVVALVFAGSLCCYAMGYDPWGSIARWTKETFHFVETTPAQSENSGTAAPVLAELEQLLAEHGVTAKVLPGYMPEGYEQFALSYFGTDGGCWTASYKNDADNTIAFSYRMNRHVEYAKDDADPEVHISKNGIQFYIFKNTEKYKAAWEQEDMECSISGVTSKSELLKIIESIG